MSKILKSDIIEMTSFEEDLIKLKELLGNSNIDFSYLSKYLLKFFHTYNTKEKNKEFYELAVNGLSDKVLILILNDREDNIENIRKQILEQLSKL